MSIQAHFSTPAKGEREHTMQRTPSPDPETVSALGGSPMRDLLFGFGSK